MRLSEIKIFLVVFVLSVNVIADNRTELHLFKYGRTNNENQSIAFLDFRDMLVEKLPMLSSEISQESNISNILDLKLKPITNNQGQLKSPQNNFGSSSQRLKYWQETGALGVLTGHVREKDDEYFVNTKFYWGELRGVYPSETITLQLPIKGEMFDTTSESHSVAILYALAHDLDQSCSNSSSVIYLLSEAHKRSKAISADLADLGEQLEKLITNAIETIKNNCGY